MGLLLEEKYPVSSETKPETVWAIVHSTGDSNVF